jgi:hypothetical protein
MKTAPLMPPPRPPRDGNVASGLNDWHDDPNSRGGAMFLRGWRMLLKFVVVALLAVGVGQLALILFQTVRWGFFH